MLKIFASLLLAFTLNVEGASFTMCNFGVFQGHTYQYANKVKQNGGTISVRHLIYANEFCVGMLKVPSNPHSVMLFLGDDLAAALTPFPSLENNGGGPYNFMTVTNQGFAAPDYGANGITGDGTSYIQTGVVANNANQAHITLYITVGNNDQLEDSGANDTPGTFNLSATRNDVSGESYFDSFDVETTRISVGTSDVEGMLLGVKFNDDHVLYRGTEATNVEEIGSVLGTPSTGSPPTRGMYLFANNNNGTVASQTTRTISYFDSGVGMPATPLQAFHTNYFNVIQRLQTRMGRAQ